MGVSASHIDWTMVPYVRKSFWKHFKTGIKYFYTPEDYSYVSINVLGDLNLGKVPIEAYGNPTVGRDEGTAASMLILNSNYKKAYDYAMDMTKKELSQAAEGLYHNLNSLQSRSGNQLKCVAG